MSRRRFLCILGAAALAGCAPQVYAPPGFSAQLDAPYTLASGDRLRIIVFGQDNLSNSYAVDGSGRVSLPLIGPVGAGGQTTAQLERAIEQKLRAGFLREPRVSVEVEQYRPFFILGEVTTAGQYPYVNAMTVQTAVAIAGGFSPRALRTQAEITRQINGRLVTATVPVTVPVRPGDTVVVRERWF
ncbi:MULTISPECIES: polysaccharide biosynthesis/export family protein [unclassified Alsobacter]|jgi:polysaccharide export outer membrane protein|uniref:Polysaccharide biosynthesis/export family protein n=1 Tax=Alsobacter sp. KACC 23698 TaxID=3149229 RepID=A0AAU7JM33_9HYPH